MTEPEKTQRLLLVEDNRDIAEMVRRTVFWSIKNIDGRSMSDQDFRLGGNLLEFLLSFLILQHESPVR